MTMIASDSRGQQQVRFIGVDWEAEAAKAERGHEQRKEAVQHRKEARELRHQQDKDLRLFLDFVISAVDGETNARKALEIPVCDVIAFTFELSGGIVFDGGEERRLERILQLCWQFEEWKNDRVLRVLTLSWREMALAEGVYIWPSLSTKETPSPLSIELPPLSSRKVQDKIAKELVHTAILATYAVGKACECSHRSLKRYLVEIFRPSHVFKHSMAMAKRREHWPRIDGIYLGAGHSSKVSSLRVAARKALVHRANELSLDAPQMKLVADHYMFEKTTIRTLQWGALSSSTTRNFGLPAVLDPIS